MNLFEKNLIKYINEKEFQNIVKHIIDHSNSVLDIGCGIGDYLRYTNKNQKVVAVEPHMPYIEKAKEVAPWATFNNSDALSFFDSTEEKFDCVLLVDVVEHLNYDEAINLVKKAIQHSNKIVFSQIPIGLHEQHADQWGLGGEYWQEHRSTWDENKICELGFTFAQVWKDWYEWEEGDLKSRDTSICLWTSNDFSFEFSNYDFNSVNNLPDENYTAWQAAYESGYNSSMGDHAKWFYNIYIESIGFYDRLLTSQNIIEYAPGDGEFIGGIIERFPDKKFHLLDISQKNLSKLEDKFVVKTNVECRLNHPEISDICDVDLAFSFLLCQSVPSSLWKIHLKSVCSMLTQGGSYFFQFAVNQKGLATDYVADAINGSNVYELEQIHNMLEEVGFSGVDISLPITLEEFNSETIWYICRAYK